MAEELLEDDTLEAAPVDAEAADGTAAAPAGADAPATPDGDSTSNGDADPLDQLLADYDRSIGAGGNGADDVDPLDRLIADAGEHEAAQQRELEFQAFQAQTAQQQADSAIAVSARDQQIGELQQTVGQLQQAIAAEQWRQHQQRSIADFERLAASEQAKLDGLDVDENHVKRWLLSEAAQDLELQRAWEARYYQPPGPLDRARIAADIHQWGEGQAKLALQLPARARLLAQQNIEAEMRRMWETAFPDPQQHRAAAGPYVKRALDRMHREARRPRIDADATADRLLVVQAMRGASAKFEVREPAPAFGELSDAALNSFSKQFGFRAI
jgi:hypothetical protein